MQISLPLSYMYIMCVPYREDKGVDKGGAGGASAPPPPPPPPILAAKINYLKMHETHFIPYAIFHCVMVLVSGVAPPVEKSCLHPWRNGPYAKFLNRAHLFFKKGGLGT